MVLKIHASDLDSFDRRLPRRHSLSRVALANQLPANPAGKINYQEVILKTALVERSPDLSGTALWILAFIRNPTSLLALPTEIQSAVVASLCRRTEKEDQCQES